MSGKVLPDQIVDLLGLAKATGLLCLSCCLPLSINNKSRITRALMEVTQTHWDLTFNRRIPDDFIENGHVTVGKISPSRIILGGNSILSINDVNEILANNQLEGVEVIKRIA